MSKMKDNALAPWQFTGQMNCDKCKFFRVCKAGESNCPYLAGWKDGQGKLIKQLKGPCPHYITDGLPIRERRACDICCKSLNPEN
jgi:hypothetical protein